MESSKKEYPKKGEQAQNREYIITERKVIEPIERIIEDTNYYRSFDQKNINIDEERIYIFKINGKRYAVFGKIESIRDDKIIIKFYQPFGNSEVFKNYRLNEDELEKYKKEIIISPNDDKSPYLAEIPVL